MDKNYDIKEIRPLAKRRKKPTVILIFLVSLLIVLFVFLIKNLDKFVLTEKYKDLLNWISLGAIIASIFLLFVLILDLFKPNNILQYDLKKIYIVKKHNKIIEIPIDKLKRIRTSVKSKKKSKKPYGKIVLITTERKRYRIRNVYNVKEVKKEIHVLIDKLKIYYEGYKEASRQNYEYQTNKAKHF